MTRLKNRRDSNLYANIYYATQLGGGGFPVYKAKRRSKHMGGVFIGKFLSRGLKTIIPKIKAKIFTTAVKAGAKQIASKVARESAQNITDVLSGKKKLQTALKDTAKSSMKLAAHEVGKKLLEGKLKGGHRKKGKVIPVTRRRRKKNDVFSSLV